MNKREKFLKEIAEVINRNSLEAHFNDTPDYILAKVAVEAMENFAEASARRDNWHGFKEAGGVRRPKGGASNGGIFRQDVPRFQSRHTPGRNAEKEPTG